VDARRQNSGSNLEKVRKLLVKQVKAKEFQNEKPKIPFLTTSIFPKKKKLKCGGLGDCNNC
jgi:hypothetical protein